MSVHSIVNCWEWLDTDRSHPPMAMQLDCETDNGGKIGQMRKMGFYFINDAHDDHTPICNMSAVAHARQSVLDGTVPWKRKSWGRVQFTLLWIIADFILRLPILGELIKPILPALGFYVMITV